MTVVVAQLLRLDNIIIIIRGQKRSLPVNWRRKSSGQLLFFLHRRLVVIIPS
jgi:hypothetical protein